MDDTTAPWIDSDAYIISNNQNDIDRCHKLLDQSYVMNIIFKIASSELILTSLCALFQNIYKSFACCYYQRNL